MAPRDQPVLAEDLLGRVVALPQDVVADPRLERVKISSSRDSHVPRAVIQNDRRISRTSSMNDCRRMYKRSNRNFCRRETSRARVDLRDAGQARPDRPRAGEARDRAASGTARRGCRARSPPGAARAGRRSSCRRGKCSRAAAARRAPSRAARGRRASRADRAPSPEAARRRAPRRHHRAELQRVEDAAALADAGLREEHWAAASRA